MTKKVIVSFLTNRVQMVDSKPQMTCRTKVLFGKVEIDGLGDPALVQAILDVTQAGLEQIAEAGDNPVSHSVVVV